jgi:hypothetical protein
MKKNITIALVIILVAAASFYGGTLYGAKDKKATPDFSRMGVPGQQNGSGIKRNVGQNGGFVNGSLLSQDEKSLTVKLPDGGSKIIFWSDSTQFMKMASSSREQLAVGDNLMVSGTTNTDGSVLAQTIQVRPEGQK